MVSNCCDMRQGNHPAAKILLFIDGAVLQWEERLKNKGLAHESGEATVSAQGKAVCMGDIRKPFLPPQCTAGSNMLITGSSLFTTKFLHQKPEMPLCLWLQPIYILETLPPSKSLFKKKKGGGNCKYFSKKLILCMYYILFYIDIYTRTHKHSPLQLCKVFTCKLLSSLHNHTSHLPILTFHSVSFYSYAGVFISFFPPKQQPAVTPNESQ